jgi:hypothetical protein
MKNSGERSYSGWGLYVLWTLLLIFFYVWVGAFFSVPTIIEQGVPLWLIIGRLLVLSGLFGSLIGILGQQTWALWLFFVSAALMIPLSVSYTYYYLLFTEDFELTPGWVVRSTVNTALIVMVLLTIVFAIARPRQNAS